MKTGDTKHNAETFYFKRRQKKFSTFKAVLFKQIDLDDLVICIKFVEKAHP